MKPTARGKWWKTLIADVERYLYDPALANLKDAEKRDTGLDDRALREHWYWVGYCQALLNVSGMSKKPSPPESGGEE